MPPHAHSSFAQAPKGRPGARFAIRSSSVIYDACDGVYIFSAARGEPVSVEHAKARTQGTRFRRRLASEHVFREEGRPLDVDQMAEQSSNGPKGRGRDARRAFRTHGSAAAAEGSRSPLVLRDSVVGQRQDGDVGPDRTGHRSSAMINRYRRQARTWPSWG
jgi:hypothetical protein